MTAAPLRRNRVETDHPEDASDETHRTRSRPGARRRSPCRCPSPRGRARGRARPNARHGDRQRCGRRHRGARRAQISAGVESRAPTARAALQANAAAMEKVLDALRARGGEGDDDADRLALDGFRPEGRPERVRRVEHGVGRDEPRRSRGADRRGGRRWREPGQRPVALALGRRGAVSRGAREAPSTDAEQRATILANAAGRELGRVTAMVESGRSDSPMFAKAEAAAATLRPRSCPARRRRRRRSASRTS